MDTIYFISGLIISIILTYWGIWHSNLSKSNVELTLIHQDTIPLFNTHEEKYKVLNLGNYKPPFNTNQYYYRGTVMNTGGNDIYKNNIVKPLIISFEDDFKVLEFSIINSDSDIQLTFEQLEKSVILKWDLIKPLEKFSFQIILESQINHELYTLKSKIKADARIADLKKINTITIGALQNIKKNFVKESIPTYTFLVLFLGAFFYLFYVGLTSFYSPSHTLKYPIVSNSSSDLTELLYHHPDSIKIITKNGMNIIPLKDINSFVKIQPTISLRKNLYLVTIVSIIGLIGITILLLKNIKSDYNLKRQQKIFEALK